MTNPKRQHYLPQFYLEGFTDHEDHLLWVFDRELKQFRCQQPKDTAVQGYYYTFTDGNGKRRNDIEEFFSLIESQTKPILDRISQGKVITDDEKQAFSIFIAFQKTRVPDFEKGMNEVGEKIFKRISELMFSSERGAAEMIKKVRIDAGKDLEINPREFADFVKRGDYTINFEREHSIRLMMSLTMKLAIHFAEMDWAFFRAPERSSFLTSDNPFALIPPEGFDPKGFFGVGILTPGTTKIMPISSEYCLAMGDHGDKIQIIEIDHAMVRRLNSYSAINSDRFIIGKANRLLEKIVSVTNVGKWRKESRFHVS
jgi:hypothetical protein